MINPCINPDQSINSGLLRRHLGHRHLVRASPEEREGLFLRGVAVLVVAHRVLTGGHRGGLLQLREVQLLCTGREQFLLPGQLPEQLEL